MRHSWLNRLVPILLLVPGLVVPASVVLAAPAHAATTAPACDPVELQASVHRGTETVIFKLTDCATTTQKVVISGNRKAPANCSHSGLNFGDSRPFTLRPGPAVEVVHRAPAPTCPGTYTVTGDSELNGTETVLDADVTTYTV